MLEELSIPGYKVTVRKQIWVLTLKAYHKAMKGQYSSLTCKLHM